MLQSIKDLEHKSNQMALEWDRMGNQRIGDQYVPYHLHINGIG
jgi:hypothetical protein